MIDAEPLSDQIALKDLIAGPVSIDYSTGVGIPVSRTAQQAFGFTFRSPVTSRILHLPEEEAYLLQMQSFMQRMRWLRPAASWLWPLDDEESKTFAVYKRVTAAEKKQRELEAKQRMLDHSTYRANAFAVANGVIPRAGL